MLMQRNWSKVAKVLIRAEQGMLAHMNFAPGYSARIYSTKLSERLSGDEAANEYCSGIPA
jgi:hypothetical protein